MEKIRVLSVFGTRPEAIKMAPVVMELEKNKNDFESVLPGLACYTANIKEWEGKVIFLHEVIKGKADRSYGVHVAELAGLPKDVIQRANEILNVLQAKEKVSLNIVSAPANENVNTTKLVDELKNIDIDSLTPKDAFNIIYNMKSKLS